ncbi:hypothetical protein H0H92_002832 [Tricholoma furcatifolium]|nr:hypothetical protein H0H92_014015 [Tricholoma furcatifolium]KAG6824406.1 hypothetical protein H0H92_006956 [Tricholoma furcatifolium]KAG6825683.1 hypothetical protein H0H92_002832 [Tricholoma furcatifolium]
MPPRQEGISPANIIDNPRKRRPAAALIDKENVAQPALRTQMCDIDQASSVDVERVFSQGRLLLSHIRNRLSAESTRSLLCLGAWFKSGLVQVSDIVEASRLPEVDCETVNVLIE